MSIFSGFFGLLQFLLGFFDLVLFLCEKEHEVICPFQEFAHLCRRKGSIHDAGQVVELMAEERGVFILAMAEDIFDHPVVGIEGQGLVASEHGGVEIIAPAVELHHVGHTAGFLAEGDHGGDVLIFELLDSDLQVLLAEGFPEGLGQGVGLFL